MFRAWGETEWGNPQFYSIPPPNYPKILATVLLAVFIYCLFRTICPYRGVHAIPLMLPNGWPKEIYRLLRPDYTPRSSLTAQDSEESTKSLLRARADTRWRQLEFWTRPTPSRRRAFTAVLLVVLIVCIYQQFYYQHTCRLPAGGTRRELIRERLLAKGLVSPEQSDGRSQG